MRSALLESLAEFGSRAGRCGVAREDDTSEKETRGLMVSATQYLEKEHEILALSVTVF